MKALLQTYCCCTREIDVNDPLPSYIAIPMVVPGCKGFSQRRFKFRHFNGNGRPLYIECEKIA